MEYIRNVKTYVQNLLGFEETTNRLKRDRTEDDVCADEDSPAMKRLKGLKKTSFPDIMATNDDHYKNQNLKSKVRYVPIQIEAGHPSTSTPNSFSEKSLGRARNVPVKLADMGASARRPRVHTPVRPVIHAVIDDDDDEDDHEVTYIESKPSNSRRQNQTNSRVYIDLDEDEENECEQPQDVIFVKKVNTSQPERPYKFFLSKNRDVTDYMSQNRSPQYYTRLLQNRNCSDDQTTSPKLYSKFKTPVGITKGYKKLPTPVPRWMQPLATTNSSQARNKYLNLNGNAKSAISELFNLNEKKSYQELIRRHSARTSAGRPFIYSKPLDIINLADDSASLRYMQRYQKKSLDNMNLVERSVNAEKEIDKTNEYDPLTVASINSSDSEVEIVPSESSTSSVRIEPVNSLRESLRKRAITSNDWLANLDTKYKTKHKDIQDKLEDARREDNIITKVNYEQKLALLEHKLKYELSIPESLIEEPQPTVELPELTPEQEKLVNRALGPGPPGQLLVEKFNLRIHRRDLQTLAGLNWLNDEVINFYMNLLMQRSAERPDLPKVYAANTFFYPKLMQGGQPGLRRWTRKVDIFAHDLMVVPVHLGVHWCLSLVDFRSRRVQYLDSMGGHNPTCLDALLQYLRDEHQDKKGQPFDDKGWKTESLSKDIPQQMNGSDCGMFSCTFAEFAARNAPYTFSQQHMPYLRRKAALEILQAKLLL